jgi:hypothetical protein
MFYYENFEILRSVQGKWGYWCDRAELFVQLIGRRREKCQKVPIISDWRIV